jgi:hypothetical protein
MPYEPAQPAGPYEPPAEPTPLVVPGAGDVFDFHVTVHLSWQGPPDYPLSYERAEELSRLYRDTAMNSVLKLVWRLARDLDPLYPAHAENEMNAHPEVRRGFCFGDERGKVQCLPTLRIHLDPKLREHKTPFEVQRLGVVEQHLLSATRDELVRNRTESWLRGFQQLEMFEQLGKPERQFLLPFAASMADNDFAKVSLAMAQTRLVRYEELIDLLKAASKGHQGLGLFEFADAFDKALQAFCRQAGVDVNKWMHADFGDPEPQPSVTGAAR